MRITWPTWAAIGASLVAARVAIAEPLLPAAQVRAALAPSAGQDRALTRSVDAEVALVGDVRESTALVSLLRELLTRRDVHPHFFARRRLVESELLEPLSHAESGRARAWITVPSRRLARLCFADPELQRYLVREVPLRDGLDELGRERIAQVVETATLALLQGAEGLSRAEVRTALRIHSRPPEEPPATPPQPKPSSPDPGPRPELHARIGLAYHGQWSGNELGLLHGPGLRVGADYGIPGASAWLLGVSGQLRFRRRIELPEVGVDVQTAAVRLLLGRLGPLADRVAMVTLLGPGGDWVNNVPRPVGGSSVVLAKRRGHVTPWIRGEFGVECPGARQE
jgi:hypothetical protein